MLSTFVKQTRRTLYSTICIFSKNKIGSSYANKEGKLFLLNKDQSKRIVAKTSCLSQGWPWYATSCITKNLKTNKVTLMMKLWVQPHHPHHQNLKIYKILRIHMSFKQRTASIWCLEKCKVHLPCKGQQSLAKSKGFCFFYFNKAFLLQDKTKLSATWLKTKHCFSTAKASTQQKQTVRW